MACPYLLECLHQLATSLVPCLATGAHTHACCLTAAQKLITLFQVDAIRECVRPTRWFTPKAIRVTVQLKLRAGLGCKKTQHTAVHLHTHTHTRMQWTVRDPVVSDMPLHANHYRNAMGKRAQRFLGMRLEIGGWGLGIGDLQKLQLQPETGNAALLAALRATCESTAWVAATRTLSISLPLSLPLHVGLMPPAALRSSGRNYNNREDEPPIIQWQA